MAGTLACAGASTRLTAGDVPTILSAHREKRPAVLAGGQSISTSDQSRLDFAVCGGDRSLTWTNPEKSSFCMTYAESLDRVSLDGDFIVVAKERIPLQDVERVELSTNDAPQPSAYWVSVPPNVPKPKTGRANSTSQHWGLGVDLAGPSMGISLTGQWYPVQFLVVEAGVMPLAQVNGAWAGLRFRERFSRFWVGTLGASAGGLILGGSGDPENESSSSARNRFLIGPRLGIEYAPEAQADTLRLEIQAAYTNLAWATDARWIPWGGFAYAHCF